MDDAPELTRLTAALAAQEGLVVTSTRASVTAPRSTAATATPLTTEPATTGTAGRGETDPARATPATITHATISSPVARAAGVAAETVAAAGCAERFADHLDGDAVGLTATYWLDVDESPVAPSTSATIRFVGQRVGAQGHDPRDRFDRTEQVDGLLPGSGRVSITTKVVGVNPGQWQITAAPVAGATARPGGRAGRSSQPATTLSTRTRPVAMLHGPGVRQAAWSVLVMLGVVMALVTQALLLQRSAGQWAALAVLGSLLAA